MTTARSAMRQYCSVCRSHYDMSVVSESAEDRVIWLKCPNCRGILPHMPEDSSSEAEPPSTDSDDDVLADIDISRARAYSPIDRYELGDVVHHRGWDDYGVVTEKQVLPGNRHIIHVRFIESGEVQLIEATRD